MTCLNWYSLVDERVSLSMVLPAQVKNLSLMLKNPVNGSGTDCLELVSYRIRDYDFLQLS